MECCYKRPGGWWISKKDEGRDIIENLTVDRYKIHREKEKFANQQKEVKSEQIKEYGGFEYIGVDGKRDSKTKICKTVVIDGKKVEKRIREGLKK